MKSIVKYITMTLVTVEIALICLFIPSEISNWQDRQSFGTIHIESAEGIIVERNQQMTMIERLNLYINLQNASNQIDINQGKYIKVEDIPKVCEKELNELEQLGIINTIDFEMNSTPLRVRPTFFLSTENPTKSMIVWNVEWIVGKHYIILSLDDETGKLLGFMEKTDENIINSDAAAFIKGISQYYGVTIDDYSVKSSSFNKKLGIENKTSAIIATLHEADNKLSCGIQVYPSGWNYFAINKYMDK